MKVRAAVLESVGAPFQVQEIDLGEPKEGEVLVRMLATGVCHSDWNLVTGDTKHPMPLVAGHEGAGRVESLGPAAGRHPEPRRRTNGSVAYAEDRRSSTGLRTTIRGVIA